MPTPYLARLLQRKKKATRQLAMFRPESPDGERRSPDRDLRVEPRVSMEDMPLLGVTVYFKDPRATPDYLAITTYRGRTATRSKIGEVIGKS